MAEPYEVATFVHGVKAPVGFSGYLLEGLPFGDLFSQYPYAGSCCSRVSSLKSVPPAPATRRPASPTPARFRPSTQRDEERERLQRGRRHELGEVTPGDDPFTSTRSDTGPPSTPISQIGPPGSPTGPIGGLPRVPPIASGPRSDRLRTTSQLAVATDVDPGHETPETRRDRACREHPCG